MLEHEACGEHWGLDLFLQEEGRWRGQPEAALKEMVMGHKGKLFALGVGDLHPWRWAKLDCARPCGTQSFIGASLVLGRRPPKPFPGSVWDGQWLFAHFHSLSMNKQGKIISLRAVTSQSVCVGQRWLEVGHFISF